MEQREITKAEVIQEEFPLIKKPKKVFRFQIFYDKPFPEFSSGRFSTEEAADSALQKFLKGDHSGIFGDLGKYDGVK